ncbi:hypothetical protein [Glaciimonas immobilis]|uniref:Uncharacterized protein n=1 Tax=Glaciimonas immobilis TaxID=728004 RepID=A0A840RWG9_9BURK|nr:hypothetical protein [Glaciimonas immobilis]KAF3997545.1 hypothetical protein HAV38_12770 [Glaciimonas immobilis]MBB5200769.1 hypothetical protein [Glaciimonas immobilis]
MENEDIEALNAGLNENSEPNDPYADQNDEPEADEPEEIPAEPDAGHSEDEDDPDPRPLTRGQARMQTLANERAIEKTQREAAEQRERLLQGQLDELRRGQQRPPEDDNLDPMEKWQRDANLQIQRSQFNSQDMLDQTKFLLAVSKNPSLSTFADSVEKRLQEVRSKGGNPSRDQVLTLLMGEQARARMDAAPAIKSAAAARVKAATGKPLGTKSNVAPSKPDSSEFDRLKGLKL